MSSGRIFLTENKLFSGVNVLARAGRESVSTAALLPLCGTHCVNLTTAVAPVLNATITCQEIPSVFKTLNPYLV